MTQEVVVRLPSTLSGVVVADPTAPLPPLPPKSPTPAPAPPIEATEVIAEEPPAAPSPPPLQPLPPVDFWQTEVGRRIEEDRQALRRTLAGLDAVAERLETDRRERIAEWQKVAVELAVTIAAKLVHDRLLSADFAVESMVRDAVARLGPGESVTVRLHPEDLALLERRLDGAPAVPERSNLRLVADATLGRGDCRAEGRDVAVLSELSGQLTEIRRQLLRSLGHAEPRS